MLTRQDELLSDFVDLLIAHGADSKEVSDFLREYAEDRELLELMEEARRFHREFHTKQPSRNRDQTKKRRRNTKKCSPPASQETLV